MATREIHLELLLGKVVRDQQGRGVGRIEEVRAEQAGDQCVVREYMIGTSGVLERLSARRIGQWLISLLGARKNDYGYDVPCDKLDLSDWERPRLRCSREELQQFAPRHPDD